MGWYPGDRGPNVGIVGKATKMDWAMLGGKYIMENLRYHHI